MQRRYFDCNAFIGRWATAALHFATVEELLRQMDRHGIERALVTHTASWQHDAAIGNRLVAEAIAPYDRLCGCWALLPSGTAEIEQPDRLAKSMRQCRIAAARFFPRTHNFTLEGWNLDDVLKAMDRAGIPVMLEGNEVTAGEVASLCERFPSLRVVMTNPSYRMSRMLYSLFGKCENLFVEISTFLVDGGIEDVVGRFGARRLLFGTRMPFMPPGATIAAVEYADIDVAAKEAIAGKNLEALLWAAEQPSCPPRRRRRSR